MKLKLKEIDIRKLETTETMTFKYKPTLSDYAGLVTLSVKDDKKLDPLNKLDLPIGVGDTCVIEISTKEEQTNLDEEEEKPKTKTKSRGY